MGRGENVRPVAFWRAHFLRGCTIDSISWLFGAHLSQARMAILDAHGHVANSHKRRGVAAVTDTLPWPWPWPKVNTARVSNLPPVADM
jgi:hypothetical protein